MNKLQFKKIYKPTITTHKNGSKITTFQKDDKGNFPLATELKRLFPNGFIKNRGKK
jgi:hypothetical protein